MLDTLRRIMRPANIGAEASAAISFTHRRDELRAEHRAAVNDAAKAKDRGDTQGANRARLRAREAMHALIRLELNQ